LDTQEAVLGELSFGGEILGQIQNLRLLWKLDKNFFQTSALGENLDTVNASKSNCKEALSIGKSSWCIGGILLSLTKTSLFLSSFLIV